MNSSCRVGVVVASVAICLCLLASPCAGSQAGGAAENDVPSAARSGKSGSQSRSVLADIAREMVTRSATNSQVLSLNLTNLLILVVLKVVVFGAGMFGFNFLNKGSGVIRRAEDNPLMTEPELLLLMSYLMGDTNKNYDCLHRVACEEPKKAKEYVVGGKMMIKTAKFFDNVVVFNPRYEAIVSALQESADFGLKGGNCEARYKCSKGTR